MHSILGGTRLPDEILVVDQSDGTDTRDAVVGIGVGAVVIKDVPSGATAVGNPARIIVKA